MGCQPGNFAYDHFNLPPGFVWVYIWVNILTFSPRGANGRGFIMLEVATLMEGEWSCYGGGQFKEGESSLRRWPV